MAKSLVEKFEQILSADPSSMVFVELAKSLLDQNDFPRAAKVCRDGVEHHPDSILGRVLLGRALLLAKDHEEGSLEFERALAIDPDNPYGYNLVAETLIRHQLYGQAVPVIEKALELQPSDLRLREWLTQARSGGTVVPMSRVSTIGILDQRLKLEDSDTTESAFPVPLPAPPPLPPRPARSAATDALLADLPDPGPSRPQIQIPDHTPTDSEVQQIAQTYERELREKFETEKAKPQTFLRRHWLAVTAAATAAVAVGAGLMVKRIAQRHLSEKNAADFVARARQGLLQDTYASLTGAIHQMNELLEAQPHRGDALAVAAQAQAMLCHDFGCPQAQRTQAQDWLDQAATSGDAEAVLTARSYLASDPSALADQVLKVDPQTAGPWIDYLAGNALKARHNDAEALNRYNLALKLQSNHVPTLVSVGEDDLQSGETSRAADLFTAAHTASPLNVAAAVGLTEVHLATHDPTDEDEKNLSQILTAGPATIPLAWRQRLDFAEARALASSGRLDKAVALLEDGVQQHGDEFVAYEGALADCYAADGQYDHAEAEAWRALGKTQKDPEALARYGEILLARGRNRELLQRVPAIQNTRRLHVLRAQAALQSGNLPLARSEIEATRKDNKVPALAAALLAETEARSGRAADAKQALRQIAALPHPPPEAFIALANLEEGDTALADARKAVAADDRSYEAHCLLGRLLLKTGKTEEGDKELTTSMQLNRQHVESRVAFGLDALEHNRVKDAQTALEAAVHEAPTDPTANLVLARILIAQKQNQDAIHAAARAAKAAPQDPETHHWLGKIALAAGDRRLAVKELKQAKKLDKDKRDKSISEDLTLAEHKH